MIRSYIFYATMWILIKLKIAEKIDIWPYNIRGKTTIVYIEKDQKGFDDGINVINND